MALSTQTKCSIRVMVALLFLATSSLCFAPRSVGPIPSLRKHVTSRPPVLMVVPQGDGANPGLTVAAGRSSEMELETLEEEKKEKLAGKIDDTMERIKWLLVSGGITEAKAVYNDEERRSIIGKVENALALARGVPPEP
eukprot:3941343-Rhodomonas_salina.1